jgi:aryl-alcohol dehydrogenase-like predicted oxidoreductase
MDFRYLGNSGLKISEITYGNWLTHGSQLENDQALACVKAPSRPASPPSTPPTSTRTPRPRRCSGEALKGERRESLEILTKVYGPTGPKGHNDLGLSRKHILESCNASLKRLQTDYVDLYQAHRFDYETPLEETMRPFGTTSYARGKAALHRGQRKWTADQIVPASPGAEELGSSALSPPQYSMLWRCHRGPRSFRSRELRGSARSSGRPSRRACSRQVRAGRRRRRARGPPTTRAARR